jgi:hypothetical protein
MFFEAVILRLLKGLSRMSRDYQVRFLGATVWQHTVLTRQKLISVWMQNEVWCSALPQGLPANANYLNQLPKLLHVNGVLGILPPNTAKTVEGPVFTGLQATINFNLARVSVSSSAFGSKNEQNQATINSHCR